MQTEAMAGKYQLLFFTPEAILSRRRDLLFQDTDNYSHLDMGTKCLCCDVCAKSCNCGQCQYYQQGFIFL